VSAQQAEAEIRPTTFALYGESMRKLLAVLFCTSLLVAGGRNVPIRPVTSAVYASITVAEVEKAIMAAASALYWIPVPINDGIIEANLFIRKHELVVDIAYTATEYTIRYKSSKNLNYDEKKHTIHRNYEPWIKNLNNKIQEVLADSSGN
jgi:hypothetical protein